MNVFQTILGLFVVLIVPCLAIETYASVDLCVDVKADAPLLNGLRKLVFEEIGHHPTHRVVEDDCRSRLYVELFETAGVLYLTARIDREVPVRYALKENGDLADRLTEGLSLVLHNDPVYLSEDISHYSAFQRMGHSILKGGQNRYRMEVFEALSRGPNATFATGGAFTFTRGSDHWQVMARIYLAGWPGGLADQDRVLRVLAGVDGSLIYEVSALAHTTFYAGGGFGLQFLRFEGRLDSGETDVANQVAFVFQTRVGVRFFRFNDFDCDVFLAGYVPLHRTNDADSQLFAPDGLYTPSLQLGFGVGF